jgi:hypothetical protein
MTIWTFQKVWNPNKVYRVKWFDSNLLAKAKIQRNRFSQIINLKAIVMPSSEFPQNAFKKFDLNEIFTISKG